QARLAGGEELLQTISKRVRRIRLELGGVEHVDLAHLFTRNLGGYVANAAAGHGRFQRPAGLRGNCLAGGEGFPGDAIQLAFALLDYYQNGISHKRFPVCRSQHGTAGEQPRGKPLPIRSRSRRRRYRRTVSPSMRSPTARLWLPNHSRNRAAIPVPTT